MPKQPLQVVLDVHEHGEDDKQQCFACSKPVSVRYEVQTADGSVLLLCKSDRDRQLKLAAYSRHRQADLEAPIVNGTSRVS